MPVFFIQDGIKFLRLRARGRTRAAQRDSAGVRGRPIVGLRRQQPEAVHTILGLMSDRALPRCYRMMQGFGAHTFRFVNDEGRGTFVMFRCTRSWGRTRWCGTRRRRSPARTRTSQCRRIPRRGRRRRVRQRRRHRDSRGTGIPDEFTTGFAEARPHRAWSRLTDPVPAVPQVRYKPATRTAGQADGVKTPTCTGMRPMGLFDFFTQDVPDPRAAQRRRTRGATWIRSGRSAGGRERRN